jgi:hypothetical protein
MKKAQEKSLERHPEQTGYPNTSLITDEANSLVSFLPTINMYLCHLTLPVAQSVTNRLPLVVILAEEKRIVWTWAVQSHVQILTGAINTVAIYFYASSE